MRNTVYDSQGFTVIEVLIAITVLAIGILAVGSMQVSSIGGNDLAVRITEASSWGEGRIESLMTVDYDDASLDDTNGDGATGLDNTDVAGSPADYSLGTFNGYEIFYNVAENYPFNDCKTIRVLVRRSDKGVLKTISLQFIRTDDI